MILLVKTNAIASVKSRLYAKKKVAKDSLRLRLTSPETDSNRRNQRFNIEGKSNLFIYLQKHKNDDRRAVLPSPDLLEGQLFVHLSCSQGSNSCTAFFTGHQESTVEPSCSRSGMIIFVAT